MAAPTQPQQPATEDMEEMQRLSNKWEPETTGPLISQRSPATAIVAEYASAGETFQQKTAWLAQKYPNYRTVRGDGRCGWRAIAFGYFEGLIQSADATKFLEEETRLRSLNNVLNAAGFDQYLYEDFADEVFDLIRRLGTALAANNAEQTLEEALNDDNVSMCIITHLRSLTKAWMVTNPNDYEAFCEGHTIDQYADDNIMPVTSEIDHVGMSALNSVLLAPAGIGLEVSYLDQSVGTEVNVHSFERDGSGVPTIHVVRLLYRPGHYDILYKPEDLAPEPASVPTYLQFGSHAHNDPIYDLGVPDFMTMIPGMSYASSCGGGWMSSNSNMGFAPPDPFQPVSSVPPAPSVAPISQASTTPVPRLATHTSMQPQPPYSVQPAHASTPALPPNQIVQQEFSLDEVPQASAAHPIQTQLVGGGPFRPSMWELKPDLQATTQVQFQTSIFRNSHFNTAHFLNPDFQPEEWSPETEYVTTCSKSRQRFTTSG
ncbi:cysteine proteinase [Polychaeton citri CBS 116435]|uniref:ubiquitinyl hydrolase 1 n=1 Tax=Polychaeton citri CBS 116435 TaxID=1314669 RepID=A0A9P4UN60_9PEZI|nr:cysteine proteinase [Polychaeton citri CBS 116435]